MRKPAAVLATLLALLAPCRADRVRMVPLWDRLGEFDLVLVATPTETWVKPLDHPPEGRPYVALARLHVQEVLKGRGTAKDEELVVALAGATAGRNLAEMHAKDMPKVPAVWFLQRSAHPALPALTTVARNLPAQPEQWDTYLQHIRTKAEPYRKWEGLRLQVAIQPAPVVNHVPCQATVWLYHEGDGTSELPAAVPWAGRVALMLAPDQDGYEALRTAPPGLNPRLEVLNARPLTGEEVPRSVKAGAVLAARFLLLPRDVRLEKGGSARFAATALLLGPDGNALTHSGAVPITIREPDLTEADQRAREEIEHERLWPLAGPHAARPAGKPLQQLEELSRAYEKTAYGPALRCGLVFAGVPANVEDRAGALQALLRASPSGAADDACGFAADCRFELARLYGESGRRALARQTLYPALLRGPDAAAWRAAISRLDPAWEASGGK